MKRPLVPVALCYAGGLLLANLVALPLLPLLAGSIVLALVLVSWGRARSWLLGPLLFCAGLSNFTSRTAIVSPHDLRRLVAERTEEASLRGTLLETPYQRVYEQGEKESWRTVAQMEVEAVRLGKTNWQAAVGRVAVSTAGVLPGNFFGGQRVEISGVIRPPKGALAEELFDYRAYLRRLGIYHQLQTDSTNDWQVLSPDTPPPVADQFAAWAKRTLALGLPVEDEPLRLLWAMTLGWKTALNGEISEPFMRSGTMHVFAISGLHIALIAGILVALLRVGRLPRGACGWIVIPLIWAYTYATGWQASAIRSTIMMTVIIGGWSLRRPSDLLNSLAAAAFVILICDPQQLFQAGFQLSFMVVFSMALFVPLFDSLHKPLIDPVPTEPSVFTQRIVERLAAWFPILDLLFPDPLLPKELRSPWQRWLAVPLRYLFQGLTVSTASWLGSIPLVAYYFHFLTPVSLLANLIVVPLSSGALASNMASLMVGGWFPALAEYFNHAAWLFMLLMIRVSQWSAQLPGGCFHIATPGVLTFVLYYAVLMSWVAGWWKKPRLRRWVAAGLAVLAAAWLGQWNHGRTLTRLSVLPLSGGEMIYCDAPGRARDLLIDGGNESSAEFATKPFLRAHGVNWLPGMLLTHGDLRQVGGAARLQEQFAARPVFLSPVHFRSAAYRALREKFEATAGLTRIIQRGDHIGAWTVLHPAAEDHFPQADDNTVVLRGEIDGVRLLLLSDLGKPGQNALMNRESDLRADIIVTGLPTQTEPVADALLDAARPRVLIVTDSEYPATARASRKLRQRLSGRDFPVLFTQETGAVTLEIRDRQWEIRTRSGVKISSAIPSK